MRSRPVRRVMNSLRAFLVCTCVCLGACDAVKLDAQPEPSRNPPTERGAVVGAPVRTGTYTPSDLLSLFASSAVAREFVELALSPTCTVEVWRVEYYTVGGRDEPAKATAAVMIPKGEDARCTGDRPLLAYAHGTNVDAQFDIANLNDGDNAEGLLIAAAFAADGYAVVAPNYVGYTGTTLDYHPYLNADAQSKDVVDAIAATRTSSGSTGAALSSELYLTGYSQGGYVAMATHRALQAAGTTVTASAPLSGPYALSAFGDALFLGRVSQSAVANFALLATSYQRSYGSLWSNPTEAFEARYANGVLDALPSDSDLPTLESQGVLPKDALFSSTPPSEQYAAITPATEPAALAPVFARGFGADFLVTNAYRAAYLEDASAHPDGSFPTAVDDQPPAAPAHPLRRALKQNDLRNWTPTVPMLLCGGSSDPTVFWSNTEAMQRYWMRVAPTAPVTVLDVDAASPDGDPYRDYRNAFAIAKAAVRLDGGDEAVRGAYHAGLVAPACLGAARKFFDER